MPNIVQAVMITVIADRNYPLHMERVNAVQGDLDVLGDVRDLLKLAREVNPHLGLGGLCQNIVREGVKATVRQVKSRKLSPFLKGRTS